MRGMLREQAPRARRPAGPGLGRRAGRRGFTLVEVLVVLAVMVIVFGLLFAPMISGLNLVSRGHRHVVMQDAVRLALEQEKRDLADAVYVFSPEVYHVTLLDGAPADMQVVDYSTMTMLAPARDPVTSALLVPVRPETLTTTLPGYAGPQHTFVAVRYGFRLANPTQAYGPENPFVLLRQQGYAVQVAGAWQWAGPVVSENAVTPRADTDLPATLSVCPVCHNAWTGYTPKCLNSSCGNTQLEYISDAVQFVPLRVSGELAQQSADGAVYRTGRGGWLGTQDNGGTVYGAPLTMGGTELDPRIVVYRQVATGLSAYVDTYTGTVPDPNPGMRWDSRDGTVSFREDRRVNIVFYLGTPAPYYGVNVGGDAYNAAGNKVGGPYRAEAYPVYPPVPVSLGDPRAPVAYVLDPAQNGSQEPARIIPGSVQVRLRVSYGAGAAQVTNFYDYEPTFTYDQDRIGQWQFCAYTSQNGRMAEVLLNRNVPPSPAGFSGASTVILEISYGRRRNFNPDNDADDIVRADYSTRYVVNLGLSLGSYVDLAPVDAIPGLSRMPTDVKVHRIEGRDQVVVNNALY